MLKGERIFLRAIEPEDASLVLMWENNPDNWKVSGTEAPYSLQGILDYIHSIQNFRASGELRLMICLNETKTPIGTLDLFEANFKHGRAGLGILIADESERSKGYARESIDIVKEYVVEQFDFYNLLANVLEDNPSSIHLFEASGFELVGVKKNWFKEKNNRINERIYQLCLKS